MSEQPNQTKKRSKKWGSWFWMFRRFGIRRTFWYWREGQRRGWATTPEELALWVALVAEDQAAKEFER